MALGDILDGAFSLFRSDVRTFLLATALVVVPVQILAGFFNVASGFGDVFEQLQVAPTTVDMDEVVGTMVDTVPLLLAAGVVGQIFTLLVRIGLLRVAVSRYVGRSTGVGDALREGARRLLAAIASQLLAVLLALAPFLVVGAVAAVAVVTENVALGVVAALLALPATAAAVFVGIRLSLALPALVIEGIGPIAALRRSWELVRGRWWPVAGTLLLAGLVLSVVGAALAGVPSIAVVAASFEVQTAVGAVATILASLIVEPVNAIIVLLLYLDQRIRGEGLDLQLADPQAGVDPLTGRPDPV